MRRLFTILIGTVVLCFFLSINLPAQQLASDSSWQELRIRNAVSVYQKAFSGPNAAVYQGYEHIPYTLPVKGDPFFLSKDWLKGRVDFKGIWYHNLPLIYDIYKDQLIVQSPDKLYRIALPIENVDAFAIDDHSFVRIIRNDSGNSSNLNTGYYEILITGNISLLARRIKAVYVSTEPGVPRTFMNQDSYFIEKDNHYYQVKTKRSVLDVLEDERNNLKKYIRQQKLNFNRERENAMMETVQYYNQLKK